MFDDTCLDIRAMICGKRFWGMYGVWIDYEMEWLEVIGS